MKRVRKEQPKSKTGAKIAFIKNSEGTATAVIVGVNETLLIDCFKSIEKSYLPKL